MIPYAAVTEAADRRWTFRLLDRLVAVDLPDGERDDVVAALLAVSDPRAVPILRRMMTDPVRPGAVRESASAVLREIDEIEWAEDEFRRWWHGPDPLLRRHALLCMHARFCPDLVRAAAADPAEPLRPLALGQMVFCFDTPSDLRLKVAALANPAPAVRETATAILFWDEPVAAEGPLLAATADPAEAVAAEAAATLQYYPATRVVRRLHDLLAHPSERVRKVARGSLDEVRRNCLWHLRNPRAADHVRRWLAPVWDLLAYTPEELSPPADEPYTPRPRENRRPPVVDAVLALLADPDTSPQVIGEVLWADGWAAYPPADRRRLRPALLNHPDPLVRDRATGVLEEWADAAGLLALVGDPDFGVRKSAVYRLGLVPVDRRIAEVAWGHLHRGGVFGVHATETLRTFAAHADPADAARHLAEVAADPGRPENLRTAAVHLLNQADAVEAVRDLVPVLNEPPAVTWGLHVAVLDAAADLGVPVGETGPLADVDHLDVRAAVARITGSTRPAAC